MSQILVKTARVYLSLEFLSFLSQLIFHVFVYGPNNLIVFILTSETGKNQTNFNSQLHLADIV